MVSGANLASVACLGLLVMFGRTKWAVMHVASEAHVCAEACREFTERFEVRMAVQIAVKKGNAGSMRAALQTGAAHACA